MNVTVNYFKPSGKLYVTEIVDIPDGTPVEYFARFLPNDRLTGMHAVTEGATPWGCPAMSVRDIDPFKRGPPVQADSPCTGCTPFVLNEDTCDRCLRRAAYEARADCAAGKHVDDGGMFFATCKFCGKTAW
jgi:hypothetical protein